MHTRLHTFMQPFVQEGLIRHVICVYQCDSVYVCLIGHLLTPDPAIFGISLLITVILFNPDLFVMSVNHAVSAKQKPVVLISNRCPTYLLGNGC